MALVHAGVWCSALWAAVTAVGPPEGGRWLKSRAAGHFRHHLSTSWTPSESRADSREGFAAPPLAFSTETRLSRAFRPS